MKLLIVIGVLIAILVVACSSAAPAPVEPIPNYTATKEFVATITAPSNRVVSTDTPLSQESQVKLDQYSDSFNPLLEKHQRLFDEEFAKALADAEASANRIAQSANADMTDGKAVFERLDKTLDDISRELRVVNTEWSILSPPPEAKRFHNLTFEFMQLRLRTVEQAQQAYNMLATVILATGVVESSRQDSMESGVVESSRQALMESYDLKQQADRLFLDVLAEARTLGNVEIIRD